MTDNAPARGSIAIKPLSTFNSGLIQIESLPSPSDVGLPDKFRAFRTEQLQAYSLLAQSQARFQLLAMGTGTGKSLSYFSYAYLSDKRTVLLTSTKGLQDQAVEDFGSMGMVDIRGRGNYQCRLHASVTCEVGHAAKCPYDNGDNCPYSSALDRARRAKYVVTNYRYYMLSVKHAREDKGLGKFDFMACDEGHGLESEVCSAAALVLTERQIGTLLGANWPTRITIPGMQAFAQQHLTAAQSRAEQFARAVTSGGGNMTEAGRRLMEWRELADTLGTMACDLQGQWAIYSTDRSIVLEPLWAMEFAQSMLFRDTPQVAIVSATLVPKTAQLLGLRLEEYDYCEIPSPFNPAHSPLYWIPTTKVGKSMTDDMWHKWLSRIAEIIASRNDRRGIAHTVSYARAERIMAAFPRANMLSNSSAADTRQTIEVFKSRVSNPNDNTLLVSPSVTTGYDFPFEQCQYQIITKIPFADSSNPVIRQRTQLDSTYGSYLAAQDLVQMAGRGMRDIRDRCENFIIDDNISWFLFRDAKPFLPNSFLRSYVKRATLPPAPPKVRRES